MHNVVDRSIVHIPVEVHYAVAETDHLTQRRHKIARQDALFVERHERIVAVLRRPKTFVGDDVMSHVQATLDGYLQQILGAFYFCEVLKKVFPGVLGQNG